MICSLQQNRIWGSKLTHMNDAFQTSWSMNTNAPYDGLWKTTRSHTWMKMLTQWFLTISKKNWEAISHNRKEAHITWYGHQVYWWGKTHSVHTTSHWWGSRRFWWNPKSKCDEPHNLATLHPHQWSKGARWWKKGALSLDNFQNLVDHEAFMAILGNIGVFSMHKGAVTNQNILGET